MIIIKLDEKQIKTVYTEHVVHDFAANERRPLKIIYDGIKKNTYECLGILEEETLVGYAFFVKTGEDYLLDYLAIVQEKRNQGLGSKVLRALADYCQDKDSLICEIENPEFAKSADERILQEKRKAFYLRNGFVDTGVDVKTFSVEYRLLELPLGKIHTKETIKNLYGNHYRAGLPAVIYHTMVKIR